MKTIRDLTGFVRTHRCYQHPIFEHWIEARPDARTIGALFHQIRSFCDSTRPGGALPQALLDLGLGAQSHLLQEIVDSEESHGPELATMAGFIVNRAANEPVCTDLGDQEAVEATLKDCSDDLLGMLPGYDQASGLTIQCRAARAVFARRARSDRTSTLRNLGTTIALEMISHRHLIPGEKAALIDSGLYDAKIDQPEMHYLEEHWGELGAEAHHESNAIAAVASLYDEETAPYFIAGAADFLNTLAALWDVLDAALLRSGLVVEEVETTEATC